jgi:hypothetical protein
MIQGVKLSILLIFTLSVATHAFGQKFFNGTFLMSFKTNISPDKDFPLLWNIENEIEGRRMVLEIQDDMQKKGVSKRVLFNPNDSTWIMMMQYNLVKQGTKIHAAKMFNDTIKPGLYKIKKTKEKRTISGQECKKIILTSDKFISEVWTTKEIKLNISYIYKLLSHCGLMSEFVRNGDWYNFNKLNGMILEVTSKNKSTGESYTMSVSEIIPGVINKTFFNTNGFRISDIPEGQNCGVVVKEK